MPPSCCSTCWASVCTAVGETAAACALVTDDAVPSPGISAESWARCSGDTEDKSVLIIAIFWSPEPEAKSCDASCANGGVWFDRNAAAMP